jgi:hypothetical protein
MARGRGRAAAASLNVSVQRALAGLGTSQKIFLIGAAMDFILTSDLDWASESCIELFLGITDRYLVKPTLFVTHESPAARKAFREGRAELGIHPNFLPDSSQGASLNSIIDYNLRLVPQPVAVRNHRYLDSAQIRSALRKHGLTIDSNVCRHLERDLRPMKLPGGLHRLPVFFEDDIHWSLGLDWNFDRYAADFYSAGLKILNFHPFFVALNIPNAEFYARHKQHIPTLTDEQIARFRHRGAGAGTLLIDAMEAILATGNRLISFSELAENVRLDVSRRGPQRKRRPVMA